MQNAELLVELGTEEIPASMLEPTSVAFAGYLAEALKEERLSSETSAVLYTPRRIIVALSTVPRKQPDLAETVIGPPKRVAYDAAGAPTRAALAFAEKNGVSLARTRIVETPKGEYLSISRKVKGERTEVLLRRLIPAAISRIQFSKTMYWSEDKFRFVRPLRWLVAVFGGRTIRFPLADIVSSNVTSGHRFLGRRRITVSSLDSLVEGLRRNGVIARPAERESIIRAGLARETEAAGGTLIDDPDLLQTVINLNECPSVIRGSFDARFLELPKEILITVMREHQKYFSLSDSEGRLLPAFLAVINLDSDSTGKIRSGHERVLRARLADAEFFWKTDRKSGLRQREGSLDHVLFQEKLGSYLDKTRRILRLLPAAAGMMGAENLLPDLEAAAHIFKCDLVTEMVKEFPDLQGVVGGLYAQAEGYPENVWRAVYEQYLPKSTSSPSPSSRSGAILSLVDRLDTVCGCFSVGLIPSGSGDPFGVRRQGNGILKIILDHRFPVSLGELIRRSLETLGHDSRETAGELEKFFEGRLRFLFDEMKLSYDSVNSALAAGFDDPLDAMERVRALEEMRGKEDFLALAAGFKRVVNILSRSGSVAVEPDEALMSEPEEKALWRAFREVLPQVEKSRGEHRYGEALGLLASLRGPVDEFFDKVLVMAEDEAVRKNRLALLGRLSALFLSVADISQIVIERSV